MLSSFGEFINTVFFRRASSSQSIYIEMSVSLRTIAHRRGRDRMLVHHKFSVLNVPYFGEKFFLTSLLFQRNVNSGIKSFFCCSQWLNISVYPHKMWVYCKSKVYWCWADWNVMYKFTKIAWIILNLKQLFITCKSAKVYFSEMLSQVILSLTVLFVLWTCYLINVLSCDPYSLQNLLSPAIEIMV